MAKKTKRGAKKKTTRKRSRVVIRTRKRRVTKRTITRKRKAPPKHKRRRQPPPMVEYSVNISYRRQSRPQNAISFQMSVIAKPGLTKDEVIDAVTQTIQSEGEDVPRGFKVRIVSWKGGPVPREVPWGSLAIISGEPTTRFSVQ